jgi:hypothetical protein
MYTQALDMQYLDFFGMHKCVHFSPDGVTVKRAIPQANNKFPWQQPRILL